MKLRMTTAGAAALGAVVIAAIAGLVGPDASVFHSPASRSSIETKVGSPPMVRRTS